MRFLEIPEERWSGYSSGYRRHFDVRPLLQALEHDPEDLSAWATVWNELHHQGDVGEASYALVAHLPMIDRSSAVATLHCLQFAAVVEQERPAARNPDLPEELAPAYRAAVRQLLQDALQSWPDSPSPSAVSAFAALLAAISAQQLLSLAFLELTPENAVGFLDQQGIDHGAA